MKREAKILKLNNATIRPRMKRNDTINVLQTYYQELLKLNDIISDEVQKKSPQSLKSKNR